MHRVPAYRCQRLLFALFCICLLFFRITAQAQDDAGGGSGGQESGDAAGKSQSTPESKPASEKPDYSKEASVIEQLHYRFQFENDGTGRRESSVRVRVQSESALQSWGQLRFGYNSASEKLDIAYVRVIKADGSVVKAGDDAVQDLAPTQQYAQVYTDYREKHVTVPGLRPGDTLEYESVTVIHTPLAVGQFWMQHDFALTGIVLDEQLDVDIPASRTIKLKTKPGLDPKITEQNGRRVYHWTSSHLEREDQEKDKDKEKDKAKKKKKTDEAPAVQLTTFASWEEVGRWYASLEKDRREPSKDVRVEADALTKGLHTDMEKVQALYDYVSTNFRYVSLSLGMARYQPHAAGDVLHNQYGDCKDKHTLLAALLEAEGLHASAVLIHTSRKLDPDVPSPAQFNHVITLLPLGKEEIWMDTTSEVAPFRLLLYPIRKKQGLVVAQNGVPHLEETPADPPMPDYEHTEVEGKVGENGRFEGKVNYTVRGDAEVVFRTILRRIPAAQWNTFVETLNKKLGLGGEVSHVMMSDAAATRDPFVMTYDVSRSNFLDWSKKKLDLKLPLSQFNPAQVASDVGEETDESDPASNEPFKIGPANETTYKFKLDLAARFKAQVPVPVKMERDYGNYESTYTLDGTVFTAERKLVTHVGELPPARAGDYRSFRRTVLADAAQSVAIENSVLSTDSAPSDMKTSELIKSGNEARNRGHYTLAINLLNRAVENSPKDKNAWGALGLAYYDSHQDDLAINAYQKQVEADPFNQFAYNNLGRVYLRQRKYEDAEKWFRKQIEVNPLDKYAHANLGLLYVEWKKYDLATPELERAASISPNSPEPQINLGTAYLNMGQDDKAMAAFDKAVQISATANVWNDIAYQLSLKKVHLDLARRYAESAVATTAASLRNVTLDQLVRHDVRHTAALAAYWDTLGWVEYADGNTEKALKYALDAWQLAQTGDIGDHAGQLYAKLGEKQKAVDFYAMALSTRRPEIETKKRLADLLGDEKQVDAAVEKHRNDVQQMRTLKLSGIKHEGAASADFFLLFSAGSNASANVESVKFSSGDEALKPAADTIRAAKYQQAFPDDTPVKIVRHGTLKCEAGLGDCTFVLDLPEDVSAVD